MGKLYLALAISLLTLGISATCWAAELKTVTLSVDKMTCNMCPYTVKKAIKKLQGISEVTAKYEGEGNGWVKVSYDPDKVAVEEMTFATEMAGYPSQVQAPKK